MSKFLVFCLLISFSNLTSGDNIEYICDIIRIGPGFTLGSCVDWWNKAWYTFRDGDSDYDKYVKIHMSPKEYDQVKEKVAKGKRVVAENEEKERIKQRIENERSKGLFDTYINAYEEQKRQQQSQAEVRARGPLPWPTSPRYKTRRNRYQ